MRRYIAVFGGGLVCASAISSIASAQETETYLSEHLRAPGNALEIKVADGYTQGFGNLAPGRGLPSVLGAGNAVSADLDYRLTPVWSVGVEGQYQSFSPELNSKVQGAALNFGATYHFSPVMRGDPWLRIGTGYRWLWEYDPPGLGGLWVDRHGIEAASAKLGYDMRVSEDVAIAPVLGADVSTFIWQQASNDGTHAMAPAQVASFIYVGLQGRFDIGGSRVGGEQPIAQNGGVTAPQPVAPPPAAPVEETKPASPSISVSEDLIRKCELNFDSVDKAPKFDFDQSQLLPGDLVVLDQIAKCMNGALKDSGLELIGRADPRGTIPYNEALGMRRADEVAAYLEKMGVDSQRIEKSSRGKLDARGTDEAGWANDRRVDVLRIEIREKR